MSSRIIEITDINDPRVTLFTRLTEHNLRNMEAGNGMLIAESPKVIEVALKEGFIPEALLCERKHITGDAASIINTCQNLTVFTGERDVLASITGYKLTRGVLCAMRRKEAEDASEICRNSNRIAVLESVCDTTNIGAIFRSAAALGIDSVFLTPDSCDPFNRRSIRVSMGAVFKIPWVMIPDPVDFLKSHGFLTIAFTLHKDSIRIDDPRLQNRTKLAMVFGTEGNGLSEGIIAKCDYKAIIPMHHSVDSLNVGSAAAIAFWQLGPK